jgi:hypothetical protein
MSPSKAENHICFNYADALGEPNYRFIKKICPLAKLRLSEHKALHLVLNNQIGQLMTLCASDVV